MEQVKVETKLCKKEKRTKNFKDSEVNLLLDLVAKHKRVLECKKSDHVTLKEKEKVWGTIEEQFNSQSGVYFRDWKTLRTKYENLKKASKRKFVEEKKYVFGMGGGPNKCTDISQTDMKVELISDLQAHGLPSQYDSDAQVDRLSLGLHSPPRELQMAENDLPNNSFDIMQLPVVFKEVVDGSSSETNRPRPKFTAMDLPRQTTSGEFIVQKNPQKNNEDHKMNKSFGFGQIFCAKNIGTNTFSPLKTRTKETPAIDTTVAGRKMQALSTAKEEVLSIKKSVCERQLQLQDEEHKAKMLFMREEHEKKMQLLQLQITNEDLDIQLKKRQLGLD